MRDGKLRQTEQELSQSFRFYLLNTECELRSVKVAIGKDEEGNDVVETVITNLPVRKRSRVFQVHYLIAPEHYCFFSVCRLA